MKGNKEKYQIQKTYEVTQTQEVSIDYDGNNFLVIYGHHINGWFIAIPNWYVCVEASDPTDDFYNAEKLARAIEIPGAPHALAQAVREHWESLPKEETECQG
ncbi:MAG: hypothetical protein NC126_09235 [Clostridium sp.]|nr:hypothetical protein [Clostridium sp.]